MSLQGQGTKAYKNYMDKVMKQEPPKVEPSNKEKGLLSRSKPVEVTDKVPDSNDYFLDQFKEVQKLRAGLKNGRS